MNEKTIKFMTVVWVLSVFGVVFVWQGLGPKEREMIRYAMPLAHINSASMQSENTVKIPQSSRQSSIFSQDEQKAMDDARPLLAALDRVLFFLLVLFGFAVIAILVNKAINYVKHKKLSVG